MAYKYGRTKGYYTLGEFRKHVLVILRHNSKDKFLTIRDMEKLSEVFHAEMNGFKYDTLDRLVRKGKLELALGVGPRGGRGYRYIFPPKPVTMKVTTRSFR